MDSTSLFREEKFFSIKNLILYAFALTFVYWIYLFFTAQMTIECDAINYRSTGAFLHSEGFIKFIKTGPHREPFYPLYIAVAMGIGKALSASYLSVLKFCQLAMLFITQVLSLRIMKKLSITTPLRALTILYIGLSPALVNTAISLYSEITVYPAIFGIVFWGCNSWISLHTKNTKKIFTSGLFLGLFFLFAVSIKGIFELIALIFLFPYIAFACVSLIKKEKKVFLNSLIFFLAFGAIFFLPVNAYKFANKKLNGNFVFTSRGPYALYGNLARRSEKKALQTIPTALAYASGWGVCDAIYGKDACRFWSYKKSDDLGKRKMLELRRQGLSVEKTSHTLVKLAFIKLLQNPLQHMLFMGIESIKMVFWETTKLGFVSYPGWLSKIFYFTPFKNGLRLTMSVLTFFALFYSARLTWKNRKTFLCSPKPNHRNTLLFFIHYFIICYMFSHSFFFVLTRYALPIAPLYLTLISFTLHLIFWQKKHRQLPFQNNIKVL